jgi:hypothetical protein
MKKVGRPPKKQNSLAHRVSISFQPDAWKIMKDISIGSRSKFLNKLILDWYKNPNN